MPRPSRLLANLTLLALSVIVALVAGEWALGSIPLGPYERGAARLGVPYDRRDRIQVILDKRRQDPNWYPAVPASTYLDHRLTIGGERILPLSGVADANVVGCNENGYFSTFVTDQYGFNNPRNSWHGEPLRKTFVVGDSLVQGECLRAGETIVDQLRGSLPGVINLGNGDNGPLLELAAIREYVPDRAVAHVVWMYFEGNDLSDLDREIRDPLLAKYLRPDFTQRLAERRDDVNLAIRRYIEDRVAQQVAGRARVFPQIRTQVWRARQRWSAGASQPGHDVDLFSRVLSLAKSDVESKGGRLLFVYLPAFRTFTEGSRSIGTKADVLEATRALGIPTLDLEPEFRRTSDPTLLFPFQLPGHYNADGARVVARAVESYIKAGGAESPGAAARGRGTERPRAAASSVFQGFSSPVGSRP